MRFSSLTLQWKDMRDACGKTVICAIYANSRRQQSSSRSQRSLSPNNLASSSHSTANQSVASGAGGYGQIGLLPPGVPQADAKPRRGSRSSILASASEFAANASDDDDDEAAFSGTTHNIDDPGRPASPVSFYSTHEALSSPPRQSRQSSSQLGHEKRYSRSSFSSAADAYLDQPNSYLSISPPTRSSRTRSSKSSASPTDARSEGYLSKPNSPRERTSRSPSEPYSNSPPRSRRIASETSESSIQATAANLGRSKVQKLVGPLEASIRSDDLLSPTSSTASRTARLSDDASSDMTRPRSKSSASMSRSSTVQQAASVSSRTPDSQPEQEPASKTAKPGLRNRLFGLKPPKSPSASSSSQDVRKPNSSPMPAFPPSLYSQASRSSLQSDFDDRDRGRDSASLHSRDTETEQDDFYLGRPRSATQSSRKSSSTSDFLRKTIRFKDKSGFLKARGSQSSAPGSPISPGSPIPSFEAAQNSYDQAEDRPKQPYKQVSGRRGFQYYDVPTESEAQRQSLDGSRFESATASPRKSRPLSYAGPPPFSGNSRVSSEQPNPREGRQRSPAKVSLDKRRSTTSIHDTPRANVSSTAQLHMPRSSSLRGASAEARQMQESEAPDQALNSSIPLSPGAYQRRLHLRSPSSPLSSPVGLSRNLGLHVSTMQESSTRSSYGANGASKADVGHDRANSMSSPHKTSIAIAEEEAVLSRPSPPLQISTSESKADDARPPEAPMESVKPGLPPKNPLRKKRPSLPAAMGPTAPASPMNSPGPRSPQAGHTQLASLALNGNGQATASVATASDPGANSRLIGGARTTSTSAARSVRDPIHRPSSASTGDRPSTADSTSSSGIAVISEATELTASTTDESNGVPQPQDSASNTGLTSTGKGTGHRSTEAESMSSFRLGRGSTLKKGPPSRPSDDDPQRDRASAAQTKTTGESTDGRQSDKGSKSMAASLHTRASLKNGGGVTDMHLTADNALKLRTHHEPQGLAAPFDFNLGTLGVPISPRTVPTGADLQRPLLHRQPSTSRVPWTIAQDSLNDEQKRLVRRWFILRELLDTEKTYASDLAVARDIYLARAKISAGPISPRSPFGMRSQSILSQLTTTEQQSLARTQPQRGAGSGLSASRGSTPLMAPRPLFRNASAELSPAQVLNGSSTASLAANSMGSNTSSNPSNRSSMYTVSSQSSQTSDASHFLLASNSPSMPSVPGHLLTDGQSSQRVVPASPASPSSPLSTSLTPLASTQTLPLAGLTSANDLGASADAPFTASDVRVIFAQLEPCAALADEMVAILEDAVGHISNSTTEDLNQMLMAGTVQEGTESDRVGSAFLKLMPRIEQIYSAYCSRHEASMTRLQDLIATQPKVVMFLQDCTQAARAHTNAWDLASLLIKPVQRVLKYPLLLAEILSSTTTGHPDIENLRLASIEIQKVADYINEVKKRKDLVDQIVSGKASKRTTSQKVQHGATKKLLRRQEKVRNLVLGPSEDILADNGQYKTLILQLKRLEKGLPAFARSCAAWSSSVKESHLTQLRLLDQWGKVYALSDSSTDTEAEERARAFATLIETQFMNEYWKQMDREIRSNLLPAVQRIALMFTHPHSVIAKRDDRELDYTRYRAETAKSGNKSSDKKTTESAAAFVALHSQLMDELPQFNYGVQTMLDICVESLSRTQATYYLRVQQSLLDFGVKYAVGQEAADSGADEGATRHANIVKVFWDVHSSVTDYVEGLSILSGPHGTRSMSASLDNQVSPPIPSTPNMTHFSPLQGMRDLPDPDFTSRIPNTQLLTRRVDALTAASSDDLTAPRSLLEISPMVTPPLGSRGSLPGTQTEALLGSPAHIASTLLPPPPSRAASSKSGGLIGLLRSVGSNAALNGSSSSRKVSQSSDTMYSVNSTFDSTPPTPLSKDSVLFAGAVTEIEAADAPTLPALTFNSGFFAQAGTDFMESAQGLGVTPPGGTPAGTERRASDRIMAAVANSPPVRPTHERNGSAFVNYRVGDLMRIVGQDERYLFGTSEHGETGWVERENFALLQ